MCSFSTFEVTFYFAPHPPTVTSRQYMIRLVFLYHPLTFRGLKWTVEINLIWEPSKVYFRHLDIGILTTTRQILSPPMCANTFFWFRIPPCTNRHSVQYRTVLLSYVIFLIKIARLEVNILLKIFSRWFQICNQILKICVVFFFIGIFRFQSPIVI